MFLILLLSIYFRVSVRLGEWNTDTEEDCNVINRRKICSEKPIDVRVESTIVHENYDVNDDNRYNDIALVRLSRQVSYTSEYTYFFNMKDRHLSQNLYYF